MPNAATDGWTQEALFSEPAPLERPRPGDARRQPVALPFLVDVTEVAEHLGVTVRHVRRLVAEGRIPYMKWGHLLRFDPIEIQKWLDHARVTPR